MAKSPSGKCLGIYNDHTARVWFRVNIERDAPWLSAAFLVQRFVFVIDEHGMWPLPCRATDDVRKRLIAADQAKIFVVLLQAMVDLLTDEKKISRYYCEGWDFASRCDALKELLECVRDVLDAMRHLSITEDILWRIISDMWAISIAGMEKLKKESERSRRSP